MSPGFLVLKNTQRRVNDSCEHISEIMEALKIFDELLAGPDSR